MPKEFKEVTVIDPKIIEITVKIAEVGKMNFVLETKKDVSKLVKRAVEAGINFLTRKLGELENK